MSKHKPAKTQAVLIRIAVSVVLLGAAIYVLAVNWRTVSSSLILAREASIPWLVASLLLMAVTFLVAAVVYGVLTLRPLRYWQTVLVEVATAFVNRLLPAGIGGLGLLGVYLYRRGHTAAQATVVVSMNNLLGMVAHLTLLAAVLVFHPGVLHRFLAGQHVLSWQIGLAVAIVLAAALALPPVWKRGRDFARNLLKSLRMLSARKLVSALLLSALLTTVYTFILFSAAHSLQLNLGILQIFIVFSLGMLTSTATPTPGGLVGAEAGLFAGFVAYGVSASTAGAAVLLYRLVTYWLPLLPGVFALFLARRSHLV